VRQLHDSGNELHDNSNESYVRLERFRDLVNRFVLTWRRPWLVSGNPAHIPEPCWNVRIRMVLMATGPDPSIRWGT
jgi:hypothetical protein